MDFSETASKSFSLPGLAIEDNHTPGLARREVEGSVSRLDMSRLRSHQTALLFHPYSAPDGHLPSPVASNKRSAPTSSYFRPITPDMRIQQSNLSDVWRQPISIPFVSPAAIAPSKRVYPEHAGKHARHFVSGPATVKQLPSSVNAPSVGHVNADTVLEKRRVTSLVNGPPDAPHIPRFRKSSRLSSDRSRAELVPLASETLESAPTYDDATSMAEITCRVRLWRLGGGHTEEYTQKKELKGTNDDAGKDNPPMNFDTGTTSPLLGRIRTAITSQFLSCLENSEILNEIETAENAKMQAEDDIQMVNEDDQNEMEGRKQFSNAGGIMMGDESVLSESAESDAFNYTTFQPYLSLSTRMARYKGSGNDTAYAVPLESTSDVFFVDLGKPYKPSKADKFKATRLRKKEKRKEWLRKRLQTEPLEPGSPDDLSKFHGERKKEDADRHRTIFCPW